MHTEMKYRFLIHYTLSFIGGYLGLYAIVSRADLFGNAQTANLLGVVRDIIGRDFSDMMLRVGALLIYMTAVILTVWIPEHFSTDLRFISIGIDICAVLLLGFLPARMSPVVALYPVFFAMPFQWCTFKAPGGYNSSTIFSTVPSFRCIPSKFSRIRTSIPPAHAQFSRKLSRHFSISPRFIASFAEYG